jgi:NTE family protein
MPLLEGKPAERDRLFLSDKGMQAIANQVFRTFLHAGLHYHIKQLRQTHPDVDIILIEPRPDDYEMHFHNIMRFSARLTIAQHGYESATSAMAEDYPDHMEILARHGIQLNRRFMSEEMAAIRKSDYDPAMVRDLLEKRPLAANETASKNGQITKRLDQALNKLDLALEQVGG